MGKHDDGRRYLNHSYHVPVGASKSSDKLDVDWEQDGESGRCTGPYKHTEASVTKHRGQFGQWGQFTAEKKNFL